MSCPCGSGVALEACCQPFIRGETRPSTAEKLMRSRYTAYTLGEVDYIIDTHDPAMRKDLDPDATRDWAERAYWEGLDVLRVEGGGEEDEQGEVEFVARYAIGDRTRGHHERAEFRKKDGRWYFHDGKVMGGEPVRRQEPKVGRNDPCPCGSGKKHKKCCGRPGASA